MMVPSGGTVGRRLSTTIVSGRDSNTLRVINDAVYPGTLRMVGGLQYTAQQLGAALGTALIGAVLITGLLTAFSSNVADDPRISADVSQQVGVGMLRRQRLHARAQCSHLILDLPLLFRSGRIGISAMRGNGEQGD